MVNKACLSLIAALVFVSLSHAGDEGTKVPLPTRPLYGTILTVEKDGTFVVHNRELYRWRQGGEVQTVPAPRVYGEVVSVDRENRILSILAGELWVHRAGDLEEGRQIVLKEPHLIGRPFAATANGDVFTVNAGSILWYKPSGEVVESDLRGRYLYGKPLEADREGNVYLLNGGEVYRYTVAYKPTRLFY